MKDPAIAARDLLDRRSRRRLDEAREGRLGADRGELLALERHGSHRAHRERKLNVVVPAFVTFDELFQIERHVAQLQVASSAQLVGNIA